MDKLIDPNIAARAYSSNLGVAARASSTGGDGGVSFSDFLKGKVDESIGTLRSSEELSARAVTDDADITDVVAAVTSAELTLETIVAVRDRMVTAYQEILRMPI